MSIKAKYTRVKRYKKENKIDLVQKWKKSTTTQKKNAKRYKTKYISLASFATSNQRLRKKRRQLTVLSWSSSEPIPIPPPETTDTAAIKIITFLLIMRFGGSIFDRKKRSLLSMTTSPELNTVHTQFGIFALIIFLKKSKKNDWKTKYSKRMFSYL